MQTFKFWLNFVLKGQGLMNLAFLSTFLGNGASSARSAKRFCIGGVWGTLGLGLGAIIGYDCSRVTKQSRANMVAEIIFILSIYLFDFIIWVFNFGSNFVYPKREYPKQISFCPTILLLDHTDMQMLMHEDQTAASLEDNKFQK